MRNNNYLYETTEMAHFQCYKLYNNIKQVDVSWKPQLRLNQVYFDDQMKHIIKDCLVTWLVLYCSVIEFDYEY